MLFQGINHVLRRVSLFSLRALLDWAHSAQTDGGFMNGSVTSLRDAGAGSVHADWNVFILGSGGKKGCAMVTFHFYVIDYFPLLWYSWVHRNTGLGPPIARPQSRLASEFFVNKRNTAFMNHANCICRHSIQLSLVSISQGCEPNSWSRTYWNWKQRALKSPGDKHLPYALFVHEIFTLYSNISITV